MSDLSVILCTYNPDEALLDEVMASLAAQAMTFEFILVDNNSDTPLTTDRLSALAAGSARIVREPRQGLAHARRCGVRASSAELICFVDDDNILAPDYLDQAMRIALDRPEIGAFAGRAHGRFGRKPSWIHRRHIARYAVRDLGDEPVTGPGDHWGPWEPFGAGLVVRCDVAEGYCKLVDSTVTAAGMGRSSRTGLGSGEDSLFSRVADRLGYKVSYEPTLRLEHVIPAGRLTFGYLANLVGGQARVQATFDRLRGVSAPPPPPTWRQPDLLVRRFIARCRNPGLGEALTHVFWDLGYWSGQTDYAVEDERAMAYLLDTLDIRQPNSGEKLEK